MENRSDSPIKTSPQPVDIHIDPLILAELGEEDWDGLKLVSPDEAKFVLLKKGERLLANSSHGELYDFPYYLKNVRALLKSFRASPSKESGHEAFDSLIKTNQSLEKKIFSNFSFNPGENIKDLWDEVIKKINSISAESHDLQGLVEKLLEVPFLQGHQTSLVVLHLKGQTKAEVIGTRWRSERFRGLIEVKDFNAFFNSIKKSKIKSFSSDDYLKIGLPFNGSFLANEVSSRKYTLVAIVSRHDFLSYGQDEIELFQTCIDLLQPHFERLIDQEYSDKRISELRVCLKDFPLPLRVKDNVTGAKFSNDIFHHELQDQDIFFSKRVLGPFSLELYDSDELRHYAFDLFHFQRISLLGELLNTLRHELSNPLFGLKLGSQIFSYMDISLDNKEIMAEIEKNVNRCQEIIENFSNLYQIQTESKHLSLKKMIDESLVLSKSESRELKKRVVYKGESENLALKVPLIFVVQILFNLIVNSAQAMRGRSGSELLIEVDVSSDFVQIDIKDNGPGIPEEKIPLIFRPFFTTKAQGTGLGLVLSRNLAVKMGGNLEYLVNNNERGAHFRLTLPIA